MPHKATSEHPHQPDYVYFAVLCAYIVIFGPLMGVAASTVQLLLQPPDSVLFGGTPMGELMLVVPVMLIGVVPPITAARVHANWIRRSLRLPDGAFPPVAAWVQSIRQWINWPLAAGIALMILMAVAAKGFTSYFYVTETGVSVRPPLEFPMRSYRWKDVTAVSVHCRHVVRKLRFHYILEMSDGHQVDLSRARPASLAASIDSISSRLNTVPGIRYEFDVAQDALASFSEKHGVVLSNALRELVLAHGGTLK